MYRATFILNAGILSWPTALLSLRDVIGFKISFLEGGSKKIVSEILFVINPHGFSPAFV